MASRFSFSKTFFRIFPPPAYLNIPYAGIDISDEAIHCLEFKPSRHNKNEFAIGAYEAKTLPQGAVEDGYIKDVDVVSAAVAEITRKLGIVRVRASLPEAKVYLFRTEVPGLDERAIAQNIESKLEENVPLSAADSIFNFTIIPSIGDSAYSASVSVVPVKVVETYLQVLKSAGVIVSSFEVQSRALARAVVPQNSQETVMLVYGITNAALRRKAGIYIVYRGVLCFSLTVSVDVESADGITKGIKEVLEYWLDHGEPSASKTAKRNVDRIVVCAPGPLVTAVEHTASEMKIPVSVADVWKNAFSTEKHTPAITAEDSVEYAAAVGLALPYINR